MTKPSKQKTIWCLVILNFCLISNELQEKWKLERDCVSCCLPFPLFLLFLHTIQAAIWKQVPVDFFILFWLGKSLCAVSKVHYLSAVLFCFLTFFCLILWKCREDIINFCCPKYLQWGWTFAYLEELVLEN